MRKKIMKGILAGVLAMVAVTLLGLAPATAEEPVPTNEIVVMVDGSGSFESRRMQAIEQTRELLEQLEKHERDEWEDPKEHIAVVSIDALPETVWEGTPGELRAVRDGQWKARFDARSDYAGCTDVEGAFREAVGHLDGDPRTTSKYLIVFSDLVHEPPTDRMNRCEGAEYPSPPSDSFPYDAMKGISVSMFWLPRDQKLVWSRALEQHGLGERVALHTDSESGVVQVPKPKQPELSEEVQEEQAEKRVETLKSAGATVLGWVWWFVGWLLTGLAVLLVVGAGGALIAAWIGE